MKKVDWFNLTVQRVYGVSVDWRWHHLTASDLPDGFTKVTGSVPIGVVSRGPRKGWPKWDTKNRQTYFLNDEQIKETKRQWSEQTGNCSDCCGSGQVFESWSRSKGTKTKTCQKCNGAGSTP